MDAFLSLDSLSVSLAIAFVFGLVARLAHMPPMLGFLVAGFVLSELGVEPTDAGQRIADFGVLLLLFTIGLKLKPRMLAERAVLVGALGHMGVTIALLSLALLGLGIFLAGPLAGLGYQEAAIIAFALSFSSTVFTVKIFEEKGEIGSVHGKIALGILIIQDLAAVAFLTASSGALPSVWAVTLVLLLFLPPLFGLLLSRIGHDELLPLFGLFTVLVLGAASFKAVGLKPDLGALVMGMLMAKQKRASEVADSLLAFKDIFLIGFFLNIGLGGVPSVQVVAAALALVALVPLKAALFFAIFVGLRLRARTALLAGLGLATYSEFGLIVGSVAVEQGMLPPEWLLVLALALAISFVVGSPVNAISHQIYARFSRRLRRYEAPVSELADQRPLIGDAQVAIFGMGRLGSAVYHTLTERLGTGVVGIETDREKVETLQQRGWNVVHGDATDSDFWSRAVRPSANLRAVLLAMPDHDANMYALDQINAAGFRGTVAAMARYPDEIAPLREAGAEMAFDVYGEAGAGFAGDIARRLSGREDAAREAQTRGAA